MSDFVGNSSPPEGVAGGPPQPSIFLECQRCAACCRWPGQVRLPGAEVARLAAFMELAEPDFIQRFTRLADDRRGLALQEKPNGECVLLDGGDCTVQPVKPQQCRDFPHLWNHPEFATLCRAIPRPVSNEERRRLVARATGRENIL
jgi:uncharacterized protein